MTTKQKIITLLEQNRGQFFSGEAIASALKISRNAVWKTMKSLQKEGYAIQAVPNKGYSLSLENDIVSKEGIEKYIQVHCDIHYEKEVTSTNTMVVQKANQNEKEGYILVSSFQSKGKGRTGHTFYSPNESGVYLSILLRPNDKTPMEATNITSMAAVACCDAIEKVKDVKPQIKWINDIFVNQKKVCGILTEASISMENKCMDYVVMGIGMNVYMPENGFPKELETIAGSIYDSKIEDGKNKLVAYFINSFMNYYYHWDKKEYYQKYKDHSMILNQEVYIQGPSGFSKVYAKDIDENFELVIVENGIERKVSSGEVHVNVTL